MCCYSSLWIITYPWLECAGIAAAVCYLYVLLIVIIHYRNWCVVDLYVLMLQEHTVKFILRLFSPSMPADYSGSESHLISYGRILNVLLVGIATVDIVQIFSLHGLVG